LKITSQLYPQNETQSGQTWPKQSNLDQYSSSVYKAIRILARYSCEVKTHYQRTTADRYYIHIASSILRERLLTYQRRAIPLFSAFARCISGCSEILRCALQTWIISDVDLQSAKCWSVGNRTMLLPCHFRRTLLLRNSL